MILGGSVDLLLQAVGKLECGVGTSVGYEHLVSTLMMLNSLKC
jgi:hypothetical protein